MQSKATVSKSVERQNFTLQWEVSDKPDSLYKNKNSKLRNIQSSRLVTINHPDYHCEISQAKKIKRDFNTSQINLENTNQLTNDSKKELDKPLCQLIGQKSKICKPENKVSFGEYNYFKDHTNLTHIRSTPRVIPELQNPLQMRQQQQQSTFKLG